MPLSDKELKKLITEQNMIEDASLTQVSDGLSWGLSSSGYDFRLDYTVKIIKYPEYTRIYTEDGYEPNDWIKDRGYHERDIIDPKNINIDRYKQFTIPKDKIFLLAPYSYFLGNTIERLNLPEDVVVNFLGKSTLARCGLIINVTPGEAGWSGHLTIEGFNASPRPLVLYPGEGILQGQFYRIDGEVEVPYSLRKGKYQNQERIPVLPRR